MLSYPNFVVSQVSTTDYCFFFFGDRKKSDLLPQNDLHLFEKVRSYKKNDGCHFSDFGSFLEGRLPCENGSDWAENLTRSVSDESAKNIFLARQKKSGCHFSNFPSILGFLQFERFDILTFGLLAVRAF